jgi:hypothetical protein
MSPLPICSGDSGTAGDLLARGAFTLQRIRVLVLNEADSWTCGFARRSTARLVASPGAMRATVLHRHGPAGRRASAEIEHGFVQGARGHRVEALVGELGRAHSA